MLHAEQPVLCSLQAHVASTSRPSPCIHVENCHVPQYPCATFCTRQCLYPHLPSHVSPSRSSIRFEPNSTHYRQRRIATVAPILDRHLVVVRTCAARRTSTVSARPAEAPLACVGYQQKQCDLPAPSIAFGGALSAKASTSPCFLLFMSRRPGAVGFVLLP